MDLTEKVKKTIQKHSMITESDHLLVGLSGGPDSVCLLILLKQIQEIYKFKLSALYVNHNLRPNETPEEIKFCTDLCKKFNILFFVESVDVISYAKKASLNKQEAARELRYKTFEEIAYKIGASKITLAHNADDQTETFFMRILRGSGLKGLTGIPPVRGKIIRPLIEIAREEIEIFLEASSQSYAVDSSNLKKDYLRNWFRLSIMSEFKKKNPELIKTVSRMCNIFREEDRYLEIITTKTLMRLITRKTDDMIELFLVPLETTDKAILYRIIRRAIDSVKGLRGISFIHVEDIIDLIKNGRSGDRINLPKGIRVIKGYSTLILTSKLPEKIGQYTLNLPGELLIKEANLLIRAAFTEDKETLDKSTMLFDVDKIKSPLIVRSRKEGDFFYPAGFGRKKKLQDFFVDERIPRDERDTIPIVLSDKDIIWVAGYRADERFKITSNTKEALLLELKLTK
ncbi:MAG: tRNA lysidine(34) synthetase TilS [Nitrospiraceae bacterium]|nr:tRNA lysidine(34) synthetase TilS [Nitrospiraceae bacterium]